MDKFLSIFFIFLISQLIFSKVPSERFNNTGIGFSTAINMSRIMKDIRFNLDINSPSFIYNIFSFRLNGTVGVLQEIPKNKTNSIFLNYYGYKFGISGSTHHEGENIRPYGEFGIVNFFHNETNRLSTNNSAFGIYTLVGLNLIFNKEDIFSYFIEVGVNGMLFGGKSELVIGDPETYNGFIVTFGIKCFIY